MNNTVIGILTFAAGASIVSAVTWIFLKKKYEKIAQEEIESVKEVYAKLKGEPEEVTETETTPVFTEEERDAYAALVSGYTQEPVEPAVDKPFVISPDEFGEYEDYDQISLTYYADAFLTDENDCLIEDVEGTIGFESLTHFGEYEDDSVFVRNDRLKCDFEILLDQRRYEDVLNKKPYLLEDE